jgi:predicted nicotinamide N-methyase
MDLGALYAERMQRVGYSLSACRIDSVRSIDVLTKAGLEIGSVVWPAVQHAAKYLLTSDEIVAHTPPKEILELGAGTGALGIALAKYSTHNVTVSDRQCLLDTLLANKRHAAHSNLHVIEMHWHTNITIQRQWDIVVGADIVYEPSNFNALIDTIYAALRPGGSAFIAYTPRKKETEDRFFQNITKGKSDKKLVLIDRIQLSTQPVSLLNIRQSSHNFRIFSCSSMN